MALTANNEDPEAAQKITREAMRELVLILQSFRPAATDLSVLLPAPASGVCAWRDRLTEERFAAKDRLLIPMPPHGARLLTPEEHGVAFQRT